MPTRWIAGISLAVLLVLPPGCSAGGAASTGLSVFKNVRANRLGLRLFLDGHEAKRNELEQAARGYSKWKIKESVSTHPKLRFEFKEPDALGRIRSITAAIYQQFKGQYSDKAEFTIVARSDDPQAQFQPGIDYDLGAPGEGFKVLDFYGKEVKGVELKPGLKYMLVFTVAAEDSETAQIYFETD
jgi:hypothetical protein